MKVTQTTGRGATPRSNPRKWLRRLHAWCGLALIALVGLFAGTGILLNHRAVMKIPAFDKQEVRQVLTLDEAPASPELLVKLLPPDSLPSAAPRIRIEAARRVDWGGQPVVQPARWVINIDTPSESLQVEHWAGSRQVEVRRTRPNLWLHLARLHMAIGTGPAWVLLADAAAIGLIFLGLSGFWLWSRLHGPRALLGLLAAGGALVFAGLGWLAG